jgi:hypothetical protein
MFYFRICFILLLRDLVFLAQQSTLFYPNSESANSNDARIKGPRSSFRSKIVICSDSGLRDSLSFSPLIYPETLFLQNGWISSTCPLQIQRSGFTPLFTTLRGLHLSLGNPSGVLTLGSSYISSPVFLLTMGEFACLRDFGKSSLLVHT